METLTYGLELELPVVEKNGKAWKADHYLQELITVWNNKNYAFEQTESEGHILDISRKKEQGKIVAGYDCVYSNLELAIGPFNSLEKLDIATKETYNELLDIAENNSAFVLNFSEVPNLEVSVKAYEELSLKKTFYTYLTKIRGHSHYIGVDGKAQISPSTGIRGENGIKALNLVLKLSPFFIALYANSPYEEGQDKGVAENRLSIWYREFVTSIYPEDLNTITCPEGFFKSWQHYFSWLYNSNVPAYAMTSEKIGFYKKNADLYYIPEKPDLITYLKKDTWEGISVTNGNTCTLRPHIQDIVLQQFSQFTDARIRFAFNEHDIALNDFLKAFQDSSEYFHSFITEHLAYSYIETRAPGSNSPDKSLENAKSAADTVHMALSAFQAGLLRNHEEVEDYLNSQNYSVIYTAIRESAIEKALKGQVENVKISKMVTDLLALAKKALSPSEQSFLSFIEYNVAQEECGADRARALIKKYTDNSTHWPSLYTARAAQKYGN